VAVVLLGQTGQWWQGLISGRSAAGPDRPVVAGPYQRRPFELHLLVVFMLQQLARLVWPQDNTEIDVIVLLRRMMELQRISLRTQSQLLQLSTPQLRVVSRQS